MSANEQPSDQVVDAIGKASEALEYVERARGHLYSFHQLMGRADIEFGNAADQLHAAGLAADSRTLATTLVGRNVLDGRWTYQNCRRIRRRAAPAGALQREALYLITNNDGPET